VIDDAPRNAPPHILVVEDDAGLRQSLVECLEGEGYASHGVSSVEEALETEPGHWDLILLDMCLPDGDGMSLLKEIRARRADQRVLVMTGNASFRGLVSGVGVQHFVKKPFKPEDLVRQIQDALKA
jgi:DNA-binding NtrC family response regulator